MSETQHQGEGRGRERRLRMLALITAAAFAGLAYATPAHADDQAPPPPLMLGKSAVIAPDEPDASVDVAAPAPATPSPPASVVESAPVKTSAADGWELAAKPHQWRHVERHRAPAATPPEAPPEVISTPVRAPHPVRPHRAVSRAVRVVSVDPPQWYQVPDAQYRAGRAVGGAGHSIGVSPAVQTAHVRAPEPTRAEPHMSRAVCGFRAAKCLQLCAGYAPYKLVENGRWIGLCIYAPIALSQLDTLHRQLVERLWLLALNAHAGLSALQYQCLGRQYQSEACTAPASGAATGTAQAAVPPRAHDRTRRSTGVATGTAAALPAPPGRTRARVLAAVAKHERRVVNTARPVPERAVAKERGSAAAASTGAAPPAPSDDWLFRALIALTGVAALSFLVAFSQRTRPAGALTAARSRLGSKGLSTARIVLGDGGGRRVRRRSGIAYRD